MDLDLKGRTVRGPKKRGAKNAGDLEVPLDGSFFPLLFPGNRLHGNGGGRKKWENRQGINNRSIRDGG